MNTDKIELQQIINFLKKHGIYYHVLFLFVKYQNYFKTKSLEDFITNKMRDYDFERYTIYIVLAYFYSFDKSNKKLRDLKIYTYNTYYNI